MKHSTNIPLDSVKYYDADTIVDYVVCPAKAYINIYSENIPARQQVQSRLKKAINEISISMLGGTTPKEPEKHIDSVTSKVFCDIDYVKKAKDMKAIRDLFLNYVRMIPEKELEIESLSRDFEIAYEGAIVQSRIDIIVRDLKRGLKLPTIIDFSNTRYEQFYNPIVYRCQMIVDFMDLQNTNTEVLVLSLSSGKLWVYNKNTYGNLLYVSLCELVTEMKLELFPLRIGWWCSGCHWRGICRHMMNVKK